MKIIFYFFCLFSFVCLVSCESGQADIYSGDLLFISNSESELGKAIEQVSAVSEGLQFFHVGLLDCREDSIYIYHSDTEGGVQKELLAIFLEAQRVKQNTCYLYRFHDSLEIDLSSVFGRADKLLGEPYNFSYILEDTGYYCSEFIYEVFADDSIFVLEPMSFKNPGDTMFHPTWVSYYDELGLPIPQGQLGCNPNGLSQNTKLSFIAPLSTLD